MNGVEGAAEDPQPQPPGRRSAGSTAGGRRDEGDGERPHRLRRRVARLLLRAGFSPNAVTVLGTLGVVFASVGFAARGQFLLATALGAVFTFADLVDGEMARLSGSSSDFGALLDSVLDRVADAAVFASVAYWLFSSGHPRAGVAALLCLVAGSLVPYVRARAEGLGLSGEKGVAHRFVRLRLAAVGGILGGLSVPHGLEAMLWLIAALSAVTVGQRVRYVRAQLRTIDIGGGGPEPGHAAGGGIPE